MYAPAHDPIQPSAREKTFRDLRRSNEYAARVRRLLEAKRQRGIEQAIKAQRKHRGHQAR